MEQKKTKLSHSTINELEQTVVNQLIGSENCDSVPDEFFRCTQTTWDIFVTAFLCVLVSVCVANFKHKMTEI